MKKERTTAVEALSDYTTETVKITMDTRNALILLAKYEEMQAAAMDETYNDPITRKAVLDAGGVYLAALTDILLKSLKKTLTEYPFNGI